MLALHHATARDYLWVGGFVLVCMTVITVVRVLNEMWNAHRTKNWANATATITDVTVEEQSGFQGNNSTKSWRMHVTYTYTASAVQTGHYGVSYDSRGKAEALVESLPGTEFPVRYDPGHEANSLVLIQDRPD